MKLSDMKTDLTREVEGVWVPLDENASVLVARFNNKKHAAAIERLRAPYRAQISTGRGISDEVSNKIALESMLEAILLDWKGILGDDGKELPFTKENARVALEIKDFRDIIAGIALQREIFRKAEVEEAVKNSATTSSGS